MSYPRTPTTTTSAATTTPNETPNEPYDASPGTPTVWATPSASTPSKPPRITHRCFTHRYFRRSRCDQAGVRHVTFHAARRTCATLLASLESTGWSSCGPVSRRRVDDLGIYSNASPMAAL